MQGVQQAAQLIAQTITLLGLQAPAQPAESVSITLKDRTVLWLETVNDGQRICVWNELLRWPPAEEEPALFENLLRLHAFGTATHGAAFAANREAGTIIVFKSFPTIRLTPEWLAEEVETLAALVAQVTEYGRTGNLSGHVSEPADHSWPRTFA